MVNIKVMLTKDAPLSSHLADYIFFKLENLFLISQATKLYYLVAFNGVVKDRFSTKSESMKS